MAKKTTNATKKAATKIKETKKTVTKKATQAKATVKSAKDKTVEAVKDTAKDVKQEVENKVDKIENKVEQNVEDAKDRAKKGTFKVKETIEAIKKDEIIINPFAYVFAYGCIGAYKASDAISTGIKNIGDKIKSGKKEKVTA